MPWHASLYFQTTHTQPSKESDQIKTKASQTVFDEKSDKQVGVDVQNLLAECAACQTQCAFYGDVEGGDCWASGEASDGWHPDRSQHFTALNILHGQDVVWQDIPVVRHFCPSTAWTGAAAAGRGQVAGDCKGGESGRGSLRQFCRQHSYGAESHFLSSQHSGVLSVCLSVSGTAYHSLDEVRIPQKCAMISN